MGGFPKFNRNSRSRSDPGGEDGGWRMDRICTSLVGHLGMYLGMYVNAVLSEVLK